MAKQGCATEAIIYKLREADVLISQGQTTTRVIRQIGWQSRRIFATAARINGR